MWIGVLWAGLRVSMWIAHVGGKFRHGLLQKSLKHTMRPETITQIVQKRVTDVCARAIED